MLGSDAYGLIAFHIALLTAAQFFDFGLTMTSNRALAQAMATNASSAQIRSLYFTTQVIYHVIGIILGLCLLASAELLATSWLTSKQLSTSTMTICLQIFAITIVFQWPTTLHYAVLAGIEHLRELAVMRVVFATLQLLITFLVLYLNEPSLVNYLYSLLVFSICQWLTYHIVIWLSLPRPIRIPVFDLSLVQNSGSLRLIPAFATATGILVTQTDKLLLSRWLSLQQFSYYVLATTAANALAPLIGAIFNVIYPRLSFLLARSLYDEARATYRDVARTVNLLLIPLTSVLVFFSAPLLRVWTGDAQAATSSAPLLSLIVIAVLFNSLMNLPYALQLASGRFDISLMLNLLLLSLLVPGLFIAVPLWGAFGAAIVLCAIMGTYFICGGIFTLSRLLPGVAFHWYREVLINIIITFSVAFTLLHVLPEVTSATTLFISYIMVWLAATCAMCICSSYYRSQFINGLDLAKRLAFTSRYRS